MDRSILVRATLGTLLFGAGALMPAVAGANPRADFLRLEQTIKAAHGLHGDIALPNGKHVQLMFRAPDFWLAQLPNGEHAMISGGDMSLPNPAGDGPRVEVPGGGAAFSNLADVSTYGQMPRYISEQFVMLGHQRVRDFRLAAGAKGPIASEIWATSDFVPLKKTVTNGNGITTITYSGFQR